MGIPEFEIYMVPNFQPASMIYGAKLSACIYDIWFQTSSLHLTKTKK